MAKNFVVFESGFSRYHFFLNWPLCGEWGDLKGVEIDSFWHDCQEAGDLVAVSPSMKEELGICGWAVLLSHLCVWESQVCRLLPAPLCCFSVRAFILLCMWRKKWRCWNKSSWHLHDLRVDPSWKSGLMRTWWGAQSCPRAGPLMATHPCSAPPETCCPDSLVPLASLELPLQLVWKWGFVGGRLGDGLLHVGEKTPWLYSQVPLRWPYTCGRGRNFLTQESLCVCGCSLVADTITVSHVTVVTPWSLAWGEECFPGCTVLMLPRNLGLSLGAVLSPPGD